MEDFIIVHKLSIGSKDGKDSGQEFNPVQSEQQLPTLSEQQYIRKPNITLLMKKLFKIFDLYLSLTLNNEFQDLMSIIVYKEPNYNVAL